MRSGQHSISAMGSCGPSESTDGLESNTLVRVDPATGDAVRFALPAPGVPPESSIGITDDAVWAIIGPTPADTFSVVGLDPLTGATLRTFDLDLTAVAVRGGFGSLWISTATGELLRLDPLTGELEASIELERSLTFMSVGPDAVWVINQLGNLFRVDPATDSLVATIPVSASGILGGDVVATAEAIWVQANRYPGVEVDPATNEVVHQIGPDVGSGSVAVTDDGAVWITAHDISTLYGYRRR